MLAEQLDDLGGLVLAHQAVVDEDAGQLVADGLVDQHGGDRRIDPARQAADHPALADLLADGGNGFVLVGGHGPVAGEARKLDEILVERLAVRGVVHFGVELHGVEVARGVGRDGERRVGRGAVDLEARRDLRDMIAVAHPHLLIAISEPAVEQMQLAVRGRDVGAAELRRASPSLNVAAEAVHHHLLAIADAQDGHAHLEHRGRRHRGAFVKHRCRAAREDHGLWRELLQGSASVTF